MTTRKHVQVYLQKRGDLQLTHALIKSIFLVNLKNYLCGTVHRVFLSALADELLYLGLVKHRVCMDRALFEALMCASELPSAYSRHHVKRTHAALLRYEKMRDSHDTYILPYTPGVYESSHPRMSAQ